MVIQTSLVHIKLKHLFAFPSNGLQMSLSTDVCRGVLYLVLFMHMLLSGLDPEQWLHYCSKHFGYN